MKKVLGLFVVVAISALAWVAYWSSVETSKDELPEPYKLMDSLEKDGIFGLPIEFSSIEKKNYKIQDFKGKIVLLSFWATWCAPCVDEFPSLIRLLDAYPEKVVLIAISHDSEEVDVRKFIEAFSGYRKNLIVTMDAEKKISQSFGVGALPEGYIFSKEGKLIKKIIGIQDWSSEPALQFFKKL